MTTDTIGGVWRFTQELVSGLLEEGCDIVLVSFGRCPSEEQIAWVEQTGRRWQNSFHYSPTNISLEWMQSNEDAYEAGVPLLLSLIRDFHADVVHTNQFCFGALPIAAPKVITAHSDVLSWADACRAQPLEPSSWLDRYRAMVSAGLAGTDAVAAPTYWMLDAMLRNFRLPPVRRVILNGRSIGTMPSRAKKPQAVTAGRLWDDAKNIVMLAGVRSPMPVMAVGDSFYNSAVRPSLSDVCFVNALPEDALLSLFRESSVYVCTSKYEPFGLAPLEAALCGCAVLANDITSLREVWGDSALYFSDAMGLTALLNKLQDDRSFLAARQARSMQHAHTLSRERMAAAYLALFKEVIAEKSREKMSDVA